MVFPTILQQFIAFPWACPHQAWSSDSSSSASAATLSVYTHGGYTHRRTSSKRSCKSPPRPRPHHIIALYGSVGSTGLFPFKLRWCGLCCGPVPPVPELAAGGGGAEQICRHIKRAGARSVHYPEQNFLLSRGRSLGFFFVFFFPSAPGCSE